MKKATVKSILLALIGTLIVSGCAKPQVADEMISAPKPSPEIVNSAPQVNAESSAEDTQPVRASAIQATFDQVNFAYDQSTLSEQARNILSGNAVILQTAPDLRISIEGHCDDRGSDEYNLVLGERRAQSVRNYLVSLGVAPERMETISHGEEMLIDMNNNEMAWAKNRRVEFNKLN